MCPRQLWGTRGLVPEQMSGEREGWEMRGRWNHGGVLGKAGAWEETPGLAGLGAEWACEVTRTFYVEVLTRPISTWAVCAWVPVSLEMSARMIPTFHRQEGGGTGENCKSGACISLGAPNPSRADKGRCSKPMWALPCTCRAQAGPAPSQHCPKHGL